MQEKFREEQRKREERARKEWERRWRGDDDDRFSRGPYGPMPYSQGPYYGPNGYGGFGSEWDRGYGERRHRYDYGSRYYDYGPGPWARPPRYSTGYRGYAPDWHDRDEDDLDGVYTPWGFYQEVPRSRYDGPQPKAHGRIGPYPFEVWDDD